MRMKRRSWEPVRSHVQDSGGGGSWLTRIQLLSGRRVVVRASKVSTYFIARPNFKPRGLGQYVSGNSSCLKHLGLGLERWRGNRGQCLLPLREYRPRTAGRGGGWWGQATW